MITIKKRSKKEKKECNYYQMYLVTLCSTDIYIGRAFTYIYKRHWKSEELVFFGLFSTWVTFYVQKHLIETILMYIRHAVI